nr:LysR family transcriptional regulator [uncultured Pseudomonas sp.]
MTVYLVVWRIVLKIGYSENAGQCCSGWSRLVFCMALTVHYLGAKKMDIKWLEDFIALSEHGSFTKAAESRFVTQPAFSRRVRSLENWLGGCLVDRNAFPTKLTELGVEMLVPMREILNNLYEIRARFQVDSNQEHALVMSTQHSLSVSFIPQWYETLMLATGEKTLKVNASDLHDCMESFLAERSDLLLCYSALNLLHELDRKDVIGIQVGVEQLIPVCADSTIYGDHIEDILEINFIGFTAEAFFGRVIQQECLSKIMNLVKFNLIYETALTESIKAMVVKGAGMAWLPSRLVKRELDNNELKHIKHFPSVDLKIMLYRHFEPRKSEILQLWKKLGAD